MGGYGSGRKTWRYKVEDYLPLKISDMNINGMFVQDAEASCLWEWSNGSNVNLRSRANKVWISFSVSKNGGPREQVEQEVEVVWTACNYGGGRPWFLCPKCGRRCAILRGGTRFYCRECHQLKYWSQSEDLHDRLLRKRNKLSDRLGPHNIRPIGMRQKTYWRLLYEIWDLEEGMEKAFIERVGAWL